MPMPYPEFDSRPYNTAVIVSSHYAWGTDSSKCTAQYMALAKNTRSSLSYYLSNEKYRQDELLQFELFKIAVFVGETSIEISTDLLYSVINSIKQTYKELCDQNLLRKCLHMNAQNCNESVNVVWSIIPNDNFVEQQTFRLRNYIAIIRFNSRFAGLLPLLQKLGMKLCSEMKGYFWYIYKTRIVDSTRHSKPDKKLSRKKERPFKTVKV
ncbi:uncharacterized protein TNCV_3262411 [Trichonephila clavipes]|nr:uncharacterized protein TNCV_3262411 [Trichonephila clavipes]